MALFRAHSRETKWVTIALFGSLCFWPVRIRTVCSEPPSQTTRHKSASFGHGWTATIRRALVSMRLNWGLNNTVRVRTGPLALMGGQRQRTNSNVHSRGKSTEETLLKSESWKVTDTK